MKTLEDIPKKFTIAGIPHTINIYDEVEGEDGEVYGDYCDAKCEIRIARTVNGVELSEAQILNTVEHELNHVFQFYFNNEYNEAQAQCFANFRREFETSKKY